MSSSPAARRGRSLGSNPASSFRRFCMRAPSLASGVAAAVACSCASPLDDYESDYLPRVPASRVRSIEALELSAYASPLPEEKETSQAEALAKPPDPFAGMERVPLTLEQNRAWTLANNLNLKVALVDPVIANETLSEEEARFEWVFFGSAREARFDQPSDSRLDSNQFTSTDVEMGVRIPLRSGGTATVELPFNRSETDNEFDTLSPSYAGDVRFSISQPLLRGAGRRANLHGIRIARLENDIVQAQTNLEVIRQLAEADRVYWRLYRAERILEVRQQQYDLALAQLERARRRVAAQVDPEVEIIRAEAGLASQLEQIIIAENDVRNAQRDLKRIVNQPGLEMESPVVIEIANEPDPVYLNLDEEALVAAALDTRMEMLELELRLAQDLSTIDFQKNQALPLFTLDYAYTINGLGASVGEAATMVHDKNFEDWSVGVSVEAPLGNEAAESRVHRAILQRLQRLSTKEDRKQQIRQEVLTAVDQVRAAWQRILAARQNVLAAARTLRAEEKQYEVGARTSTEVLDAQTRLADAQASEIAALVDYQVAQIDLAFATGMLMGAARVEWTPRDPRGALDAFGDDPARQPKVERTN